MANDKHQLAEMTADHTQGWLANVLAEEGEWSRLSLWQLGSWAAAAIGAIIVAFISVHFPIGLRQEQAAADDLVRQSQQIQWIAKDSQSETRRLASALEILNSDRDRLFARVTAVEQGLDSVTGSVARQTAPTSLVMSSASQPLNLSPAPTLSTPPSFSAPPSEAETASKSAPVEQKVTTSLVAAPKEAMKTSPAKASSDTSALKPFETQPLPPVVGTTLEKASDESTGVAASPKPPESKTLESKTSTSNVAELKVLEPKMPERKAMEAMETSRAVGDQAEVAVQRTVFGVDLGGANSVDGLRGLWQSLVKSNAPLVASLQPIIAIKERRNGLGMQLRLVAGPLNDAAAAAKICADLAQTNRACETAVYDGQRLVLKDTPEEPAVAHTGRKRARNTRVEEPPPQAQPPAQSALLPTPFFSR
jgi:hypothetical protein